MRPRSSALREGGYGRRRSLPCLPALGAGLENAKSGQGAAAPGSVRVWRNGRREGLKHPFRKECRFDSDHPHHEFPPVSIKHTRFQEFKGVLPHFGPVRLPGMTAVRGRPSARCGQDEFGARLDKGVLNFGGRPRFGDKLVDAAEIADLHQPAAPEFA